MGGGELDEEEQSGALTTTLEMEEGGQGNSLQDFRKEERNMEGKRVCFR